MTIHIIHENKTYVGRVVYNFNQISNAIALLFDKPIYHNKTHILLKFDENMSMWIDEDEIYKNDSILFGQILNKINNLLKEKV
jgi:hypothetical protein